MQSILIIIVALSKVTARMNNIIFIKNLPNPMFVTISKKQLLCNCFFDIYAVKKSSIFCQFRLFLIFAVTERCSLSVLKGELQVFLHSILSNTVIKVSLHISQAILQTQKFCQKSNSEKNLRENMNVMQWRRLFQIEIKN